MSVCLQVMRLRRGVYAYVIVPGAMHLSTISR